MTSHRPPLLQTMTGELYQLARVHYKVHNPNKVIKTFSELKCMDLDPLHQRWTWLYHQEAQNLGLEIPWNQVPRDHIPIILGSFYFRNENEGFFNFNSFQRATTGIVFFNQLLSRSILEVTEIEVLNKLFSTLESDSTVHSKYFDKNPSPSRNSDLLFERLVQIDSSFVSLEDKKRLFLEETERYFKEPLPEIERFHCHFYEEGIFFLETALKIRETITLANFLGNKTYSFSDLIGKTV